MFTVAENERILNGLNFIDLFSGIGGFHTALTSLGGTCVFASEINTSACDVYEVNYGMRPLGDIQAIKANAIPEHDILCAGFPCQAFSISGKRKGFSDDSGKLFFQILKIIRYHTPRLIVLENVKNLLTHDEGRTIRVIEARLEAANYTVFKKVISSNDFGVPQLRKRIYIVAFRNDCQVTEFDFPQQRGDRQVVNDILEDNVDDRYWINREAEFVDNINELYQNTNRIIRVGSVGQGRQGERIYSPRGLGVTLSSQGGGLGGKTGMYLVGERFRRLTPRECARIMGFPENFQLPPTDGEAYKQLGNSVVVNVLQEIVAVAAQRIVLREE